MPAPTLQVGVWGIVGDRGLDGSSRLPFSPSAPSITASMISSLPRHEERVVSDSILVYPIACSNMLGREVVWPWDYCFSLPGPLFNFDVHDDVRLLSDATVEKDEV